MAELTAGREICAIVQGKWFVYAATLLAIFARVMHMSDVRGADAVVGAEPRAVRLGGQFDGHVIIAQVDQHELHTGHVGHG